MRDLIDGVQRFQRSIFPSHRNLFEHLAHGQSPEVLFVCCADSRVDPSLLTQTEPGKLFVLRNAGNLVPPAHMGAGGEAATVAYAVDKLEVHHVVVCGHSACGAVTAALEGHSGDVIAEWLENAGDLREEVQRRWPDLEGGRRVEAGVYLNVLQQLEHLRTHPSVARAEAEGRLALHGWVYDIASGSVNAWDPPNLRFSPLQQAPEEEALVEELQAPAPTLEEGWLDHGPWRAELVSVGTNPIEVAEAVRQITGWDDPTVQRAVRALPVELLHGLTEIEAGIVRAWIRDTGGRVKVSRD